MDQEMLDSGALIETPNQEKWGWDWLSHIYHLGTCHPLPPEVGLAKELEIEYTKSHEAYCETISGSEPEVELIKGGERIHLPVPDLDSFKSISLWQALEKRRTCRDFDGSKIILTDLSDILNATYGDQKHEDSSIPSYIKTYGFRRTSPASGGLQCTEAYVWAINVQGLAPGIYHYLSCQHQLEVVRENSPEHPIGTYLCNQQWANDMAFAIIMTCRLDKMWWKYPHSRAYRPMLMDVGHLSQTLNLCITAKGLRPWLTGYFHDKEISELLKCDDEIEQPILVVGGGNGTGSSLPRESRALFEKKQENENL